jgi:glycosyltransferase involved in cell wall biosynthesis
LKILYEITYGTRGNSGIPRDAKQVGKALLEKKGFSTDFILNPRSFVSRNTFRKENSIWVAQILGSSLRKEDSKFSALSLVEIVLAFLQSLSINRFVRKIYLNRDNSFRVLKFLNICKDVINIKESKVVLMSISYPARFFRPKLFKPYKLSTKNYRIFIQQQLDPISVSKNTVHIVRLHDVLPISHPQYFEDKGVRAFSKSLSIMLSGRKKIWVMDSEASAMNFKHSFGEDLDVRVIPCAVSVDLHQDSNFVFRKNQICIVNTIEPRKKVGFAISGFKQAKLLGRISTDWELVIVGEEGWQETKLVSNLRGKVFGQDVNYVEGVTDFELKKIYKESKIVLSTSDAEGFGLPPLEGMANGCVPVLSDIPQHRETIADFGIFFSPDNLSSLVDSLAAAVKISDDSTTDLSSKMQQHIIENFSEELISEKWFKLLNEFE